MTRWSSRWPEAGNVILAAEASSEGLVDARAENVQPPLDGIQACRRMADRVRRTAAAAHPAVPGAGPRRPRHRPRPLRLRPRRPGPPLRAVCRGGRPRRAVVGAPWRSRAGGRAKSCSGSTLGDRDRAHTARPRVPWADAAGAVEASRAVCARLVDFARPSARRRLPVPVVLRSRTSSRRADRSWRVRPPHLDPAVFKDRIVVVGVTAEGLKDIFTTPFGEGSMPGAEFHANVHRRPAVESRHRPGRVWQWLAATLAPALVVGAVGGAGRLRWPRARASALADRVDRRARGRRGRWAAAGVAGVWPGASPSSPIWRGATSSRGARSGGSSACSRAMSPRTSTSSCWPARRWRRWAASGAR